ncbi:EIF3A, partial [Symbiodinium sp. KB8]
MLPGMKPSKCVAKHCASTNKRNQHIVQKMMAASAHYCSRDICFLQESEATGLLQKPRSGGQLVAAQVNASKGCLSEEDVCDGFCNALMGKEDGHKPVDAQCKEKCM